MASVAVPPHSGLPLRSIDVFFRGEAQPLDERLDGLDEHHLQGERFLAAIRAAHRRENEVSRFGVGSFFAPRQQRFLDRSVHRYQCFGSRRLRLFSVCVLKVPRNLNVE